jgi:glycosyltransferase involved in cell wall biosynthesis
MKIAFFHELNEGGARRAVYEFASGLMKNNEVDLYVVDDKKDLPDKKLFNQIFHFTFTPKKWQGGNWKVRLYKDTVELYQLYKLHKAIAKKLQEKKYDIVIVYPSKFTQSPFLLRFLHLKKLYYCMEPLRLVYDPAVGVSKKLSTSRYLYEKANRSLRKAIDRQNVSYTDVCLAPSRYIAGFFSKIYNKSVETVYCGVDTTFFAPNRTKKEIDLLFVGSKSYFDGYDLYKEVLKHIKTKVKTREILSENEWLTDEQMRLQFRRTKILLALSHNEPLGLVPLEVASCGTAVVAVDEAGYKETVLNGKNGYLVPRNPQKIAKMLDQLLADQNTLEKMGAEGRKLMVTKWTWKSCAQDLENAIREYLHK